MSVLKGYRLLEHTSDVYIEAYGGSLAEAFEEGGKALFSTLVKNIEEVLPKQQLEVTSEGADAYALLYDWLEKLLLLFEINRFVGSDIKIRSLILDSDPCRLNAIVSGETYDEERHRPGIHVKSPTYWLMEMGEQDGKKYIRFVLDI